MPLLYRLLVVLAARFLRSRRGRRVTDALISRVPSARARRELHRAADRGQRGRGSRRRGRR